MKYVAAPLLVTAYGVIRLLDGRDGARGPGPAWTSGHLAFIAALILFVPIVWDLRRRAGGGGFVTGAAVAALAGIAALAVQFGIDLVVGFRAADHEAMGPLFDRVRSGALVEPVVYQYGPILFLLGLLVLVIALAARGGLPAWAAAPATVGMLMQVQKDLIPVAGLLMLAGLLPLVRFRSAISGLDLRRG